MSCVDAMDINNMYNVTINEASVSVVGMDDSSGSFSNLQNEIDICENNDFKLTKNYEYSSTEKPYDGISIFKDNFTVDGQGHTIKGHGKSKMFDIRANNVTIKNINFINGYSEFYGGAIFFDGSGLIENCTFKNNIAQLGGAIFIRENVTVKNSIFMNNIAESGGAINFLNNGIIENCSFENNTDSIHDANDQYNGAIFCEKGKEHIIITNCYFDHIKEPSIFEYSILIPNYVNVTNI